MDTIVMKFGGSSVADNIRLNLVAEKIIELYNQNNNVVVVVSAQGKTTDNLIKEAGELSSRPSDREMDMLLSCGEQITIAKLSILLNRLGYKAISLTGWQAGICTSNTNQDAIIENINTERLEKELNERKIVVVAGFQGINENTDITTLGRGGSDTTAVALASALKAKHCYIFSDVDGVYTTDPNKVKTAMKLDSLSYEEMLDISSEGAKVLHNRCVEIAEKFNIPIITKSTFNNKTGTIINDKIEDCKVKGIVKNDNITFISARCEKYTLELFDKIYRTLLDNGIQVKNLINNSTYSLDLCFYIKSDLFNKFAYLLETDLNMLECTYYDVTRISIVGHGIMNNSQILIKTLDVINNNKLEILNIDVNESKLAITLKNVIENSVLEQLHNELIH
ncbi:MAG: aspartate kinase [Clostridia bacterium]|nr:aspartate kinase [Clostridia bacterium]